MSTSYTYTYGCQRRRRKTDWAGIGPGDACKNNLDYFHRLQGQRLFYQLVRRVQKIVAARTGDRSLAAVEGSLLGRSHRGSLTQRELRVPADRGERSPEFVARIGDEAAQLVLAVLT